MKLNPHEINTSVWQKIEAHYTPILAKYRTRIENPRIEEKERIELAWKIASVKELLALAEPDKTSAEQPSPLGNHDPH